MTKNEFICNALLQLIGNSVYGKCDFCSAEIWRNCIQDSLDSAIDIAEYYDCLDEEPDEPP